MIMFGCTTTKYWCRSNSEVEKRYALAQHCCTVSLERTKNFTRPCINMSLKIFKGFNATICLSFSSDGADGRQLQAFRNNMYRCYYRCQSENFTQSYIFYVRKLINASNFICAFLCLVCHKKFSFVYVEWRIISQVSKREPPLQLSFKLIRIRFVENLQNVRSATDMGVQSCRGLNHPYQLKTSKGFSNILHSFRCTKWY